MDALTVTKTAVVNNPKGLHMRPAGLLVEMAKRFQSDIEIDKNGVTVSGRSILDVLTLVAESGETLTIRAQGSDAQEAVEALAHFLETDSSEE